VELCADPYQTADQADVLLLITEWSEFKQLDLVRLRRAMRRPIMIDGRNFYDPATMAAAGFEYRSIGRPAVGGQCGRSERPIGPLAAPVRARGAAAS
jgi:UDPglucose 6-dehydrogenase